MPRILAIFEQKSGNVKKSSLELITACEKLTSSRNDITAVVFGPECKKAAESLGDWGVSRVYIGEKSQFENYEPETYVKTLEDIAGREKPQYILALANPFGKDVLARLSARLNAAYVSDSTGIGSGNVFTKPIFAGKLISDAKPLSFPALVSFRPNTFLPAERSSKVASETISLEAPQVKGLSKLKERKNPSSEKRDLQETSVIVSGGRAMKSADNFKILQELADAVGAATGASRAAVDSEYATQDMQVGQTGKVVNPNLYIACGISGQIQHLAGMRTSKVIVAINKDPEAPIFKYADYGIAGDLFEVVPALTLEFKKAMKE